MCTSSKDMYFELSTCTLSLVDALRVEKIDEIRLSQSADKHRNPSLQIRAPASRRKYTNHPCTQTASATPKVVPTLIPFSRCPCPDCLPQSPTSLN